MRIQRQALQESPNRAPRCLSLLNVYYDELLLRIIDTSVYYEEHLRITQQGAADEGVGWR